MTLTKRLQRCHACLASRCTVAGPLLGTVEGHLVKAQTQKIGQSFTYEDAFEGEHKLNWLANATIKPAIHTTEMYPGQKKALRCSSWTFGIEMTVLAAPMHVCIANLNSADDGSRDSNGLFMRSSRL